MKWIQENFKKIIYVSFLIPIILVALVSISHVTKWYGISNPLSWAIYLSVGIEIAALAALAAISAKMGKKVYFPFGIVTLIQFIGNIFFAYQFIDINSQVFKDWVDLVSPIVSYMGVEATDLVAHKRFLSFFSGGMLPMISLSFLHMLVKFEEQDKDIIPVVKNDEKHTIEIVEKVTEIVPEIKEKTPEATEPPIMEETTEIEPEMVEEVVVEEPEVINEEEPEMVEEVVVEEPESTSEKEKKNMFEPRINRLSYTKNNG